MAPASLAGSVATELKSVQWDVSRKDAVILLGKQEGSPFPPLQGLRRTPATTMHPETEGRLGGWITECRRSKLPSIPVTVFAVLLL